jgi:methionyl-tRNA formyltransferase
MLKSIFFGNSEFVLPILEVLFEYTQIQAIITGPDKIITKRKTETFTPPPKIFAKQKAIPCLQPLKLKDPSFISQYNALEADIGIVTSYGKILPPFLFEKPRFGILNLHSSILPYYRGASPIQEALLHGDHQTGVTLQRINENIDEGNFLLINKIDVPPNEYYPQLRQRLSLIAAKTLKEAFEYYEIHKTFPPEQAQVGEPSFCGKITKEKALISFQKEDAESIYNQFRAFYSWPQTECVIHGKTIKLLDIKVLDTPVEGALAGQVLEVSKNALIINTKHKALSLVELQPENKKRMDFISFINGYQLKKGEILP